MADSFFFYDTETTGINSRSQRILQFAGVRTDLDFNEIDKPLNVLIKLSDEILPEPEAIAIHGITPQQANREGLLEDNFLKLLNSKYFLPGTILAGFNNIRFDDDFLRNAYYRNLYDPYVWHWENQKSRWDLLDAMRMARALRPDGIIWPLDENSKPSNRLGLLAKANNVLHDNAHDALSDVRATIGLAKLLKSAQPALYKWLFANRNKTAVREIVNLDEPAPFVYTSGQYSSEFAKTTIAFPLMQVQGNDNGILVYDLRYDPTELMKLSLEELKVRSNYYSAKAAEVASLPIKTLSINKCPAVAPLRVLDEGAEKRISLDKVTALKHAEMLTKNKVFADMIRTTYEKEDREIDKDVDFQMLSGFYGPADKLAMQKLHALPIDKLADYEPIFKDERLSELLSRFKARNYPQTLSAKEQIAWQVYRNNRLKNGLPGQPSRTEYLKRVATLKQGPLKDLAVQLEQYAASLEPSELSLF